MKKKTGLVFFPAFDYAITPTHPEREERLLYTQDQVVEEGLLDFDNIKEFKPDLCTAQDIQRVHFCVPGIDEIVHSSHLIAVGGTLTAADKVMTGEVDNAFALVRPCGHHSMRVVHGSRGFCTLNMEAIMVEYIRQKYGVRRIAIVDTDCHHGDGSQDIFWHDPDILFISMHQDGRTLYPGSGFPDELGGPNAFGTTINLPMPPGTCEEGFLYVLDEIIMPIVNEFQPELIINSAGQDNHYSDPITNMKFTARGYAILNDRLKPDIAVLEGGYSIESALPYINTGIILAMAGMDYSEIREPDYDAEDQIQPQNITTYLEKLKEVTFQHWNNRNELRKQVYPDKPFHTRSVQIFYDTARIRESINETVRTCNHCGGAVTIESRADTGKKGNIFAVQLPRYCCDACREWGEEQYENAPKGKYAQVFMQDKDNDLYLEKN
ncbi:MAG: histone deacetylase [Oxalobacter sp.]|nr:MAG: histone deacetylase [Oxalobacter sp.]